MIDERFRLALYTRFAIGVGGKNEHTMSFLLVLGRQNRGHFH
jgi:hypothetical protein